MEKDYLSHNRARQALIENIQFLSPLDEATAFNAYVTDFGWGGVTDLAS
jgi:hypothetical protein